ncbi:MAG: hypothetical protein ABSC56_10235 [Solirubrobacteraceae bacterium]|jgi:hypothetical protein
MPLKHQLKRARRGRLLAAGVSATLAITAIVATAEGDVPFGGPGQPQLYPNNLLIARSVYAEPSITAGATGVTGTLLPPNCTSACGHANTDGTYPQVFNNDEADGSFGITSPIFLDQVDPNSGRLLNTITVPTSDVVTSFSSKSELALNLSTNGKYVSFMGYDAPAATLDVSNADTPGEQDTVANNNDVGPWYREVVTLDSQGNFKETLTNAYSGDNGRAAIIADGSPTDPFGNDDDTTQPIAFTAGNADDGGKKTPFAGGIEGAGAQALAPSIGPKAFQNPGAPTPVGSFNITQLGDAADKVGKDTNFRGETIYNNVVYYTKGSGSNGVNTVYFIDTTGKACPNGVGVPQPGAALPSAPIDYNPATVTTQGVAPYNMCILAGFPTTLASASSGVRYPFGIWFANADTLYVADEGSNTDTYNSTTNTWTDPLDSTAGLQKWVFNSSTQQWQLAYTLQNGLKLGVPYSVPGYPTGVNGGQYGTGLPWAPATSGLRNITGRVNSNGTATIWAETATQSGSGDEGADPNEVVAITDSLNATSLPSSETFQTIAGPTNDTVYRGVSLTPGSTQYAQQFPQFPFHGRKHQ